MNKKKMRKGKSRNINSLNSYPLFFFFFIFFFNFFAWKLLSSYIKRKGRDLRRGNPSLRHWPHAWNVGSLDIQHKDPAKNLDGSKSITIQQGRGFSFIKHYHLDYKKGVFNLPLVNLTLCPHSLPSISMTLDPTELKASPVMNVRI